MFLEGKPDTDKISFSVTDERGVTVAVEISTDLIMKYINGFTPDEYLSTQIDEHGFFIIDGKKSNRHHTKTSKTGELLKALLDGNGKVVSYKTIKESTSVSTKSVITKTFKDLKHQLKKDGYRLDYTLVKSTGIALGGIAKLQ